MDLTDRPSPALDKSLTLSHLRYTQVVTSVFLYSSQSNNYDVDVEMFLNYYTAFFFLDLFHLSLTDLSPPFFRSFVCVRLEDEFCFPNEEEGWWGKYSSPKGHLRRNEC